MISASTHEKKCAIGALIWNTTPLRLSDQGDCMSVVSIFRSDTGHVTFCLKKKSKATDMKYLCDQNIAHKNGAIRACVFAPGNSEFIEVHEGKIRQAYNIND